MMDKELNYNITKRGIILLVLLFIIPNVFAAEKSIFSGTVLSNKQAEVDGQSLTLVISGNREVIEYRGLAFLINGLDCSTQDFIKVCVTNLQDEFSADISVSVIVADIATEKSIKENKYKFVLGEIFNVKLNITNIGERPISYIKINENLEDFQILDANGCDVVGLSLTKETTLSENSRIICNYKLRAIKPGDLELRTEINFFDGYENKSKTVTENIEVVEQTLKLNYNLESNYTLGDKKQIKFNLTNIYPYTVTLYKLEIKPTGIEVLNSTLQTKDNSDMLKWSGDIKGNGSFAYTLDLELVNISNELLTTAEYSSHDGTQEKNFTIKLPTEANTPEIKIIKVKKDYIIIRVTNPNSNLVFNRMNITINSPFNNVTTAEYIDILNANDEKVINVDMPIDKKSNISAPVAFSGEFQTEYGEKIKFSSTDYIRVNVTQEQNETNTEGQIEERNVTIQNPKKSKILLKWGIIIFSIILLIVVVLFLVSIKHVKNPK